MCPARVCAAVLAILTVGAPAAAQCVDLNTAPLQELSRIVHVGQERAAEIVARRPFSSLDELEWVSGLGPSRLADIKAQGLACVAGSAPGPHPPVTPTAPAASDRVTLRIASREVVGDSLRVFLTTGEVLTIASSELVYVRDEWPHWNDDDGDCQDARQEVLIAESQPSAILDESGCRVVSGRWVDRLTGEIITDPAKLDVDHLVPLANAFRSGAWSWDRGTRTRYANYLADPWHLTAVSAAANRAKGDRGPDEWRPPQQAAWCTYAREWTMIKQRWLLRIAPAEQAALSEMLASCGS